MATLKIKDLDENVELDREAMKKISGGAGSPWQSRTGYRSLVSQQQSMLKIASRRDTKLS